MRPLAYLLLMAVTVMLTSCGPALNQDGSVKEEAITFEGQVMGHDVYWVKLPSGTSIYFVDDGKIGGKALALPGESSVYTVQASSADETQALSTEDLIARRDASQAEIETLNQEITRRAEALQEQVNLLKKKD